MIKNFFLFFWALALFATLSKAQVSSVTGQYLQDNNLLLNPGFESGIGKWTNSAGTFTADYSVFVQGKASGKVVLSSQALNFFQDSTLFASQLADGMQAILTVKIKSSVAGVRVCPRQAGSVITSLCIDVQGNNKWGLYQIPFVTGATSQGISINSNSTSITGTVYVDESYVGTSGSHLLVSGNETAILATWSGSQSLTHDSDVKLTLTNATYSTLKNFTVSSGTFTATVSGDYLVNFAWRQTFVSDASLDRQRISKIYKNGSLLDRSGYISGLAGNNINTGGTGGELPESQVTRMVRLAKGDTLEFYAYQSNGSGATRSAQYARLDISYISNSEAFSTLNADTDWAACNFSTLAWQGLGTVTNNLECKRQGGDLLIKGRFTSGTVSGVEARMNLPTWNGVQLTSAGAQRIPIIQLAGSPLIFNAPNSSFFVPLIEPSVSYITFGLQATSVNAGLTKVTGSVLTGSAIVQSINARIPIEGWQNSNIIIGAFNGLEKCIDSYECSDVFSASIAANTGIVSRENIDFLNGNCTVTTGTFTCPLKSGIGVTQIMNCEATVQGGGRYVVYRDTSSSSSQLVFGQETLAGVNATDTSFNIICQKQGVDYIGKTAKAVASDQNVRSVGAVGVDIQSVYFGSGASCLSPCTTATCTICKQVGSKITSITRTTNGTYNLNGIDGTKYQCTGTANNSSTAVGVLDNEGSSTTSFRRIVTYNGGVTTDVGMASVQCIGVP